MPESKEGFFEKHKDSVKAFEIVVAIITIIISFNQIAQPIFGPRVDSLTITPLYVQNYDTESPDFSYYKVFKVSYIISPPLFSDNTTITLNLPNSENDSRINPIDMITGFKQTNPYSEILLGNNEKPEDKINVLIKPKGLDVKSVTVDLYLRQKLDGVSDTISGYWWTQSTISPEFPVIQTYRDDVIGSFFFDKYYYEVHRIILQNKNNYEIRNFKLPIYQRKGGEICYNKDSPTPVDHGNYLMFDVVQPQEKSSLLYFEIEEPLWIKTPSYNLTELDCPTVMKMFS